MRNRWIRLGWLLALAMLSAGAQGAVCTSLSAGDWNVASRWDCGGVNRIPLTTDSVVIAHNAIRMRGSYTVAGLTINAGAVLDGNNRNLTVSGPVLISGTYDSNGGDLTTTGGSSLTIDAGGTFDFNNGNASISGDVVVNGTLTSGGDAIQMTGANTTVSGTGTIDNTDFEIEAMGISLPAGSTLEFSNGAQLRVGNNNAASFTLDGTITGFGMAAGDRLVRVYQNSAMTINGTVNAPNAYIRIEQDASITNNGTVSVQYLRTDAATAIWTQGDNSNLALSVTAPAGDWNGVLNASAPGNTVTYNGTSTVIPPSAGYWNLAGTIFPGACPVAYTIMGSDPCPVDPGAGSVTSGPTSCSNLTGVGTVAWSTPANAAANDGAYATATLLLGATSNYLNCTGYNFSAVPDGATITGITVTVDRNAGLLSGARDAFVHLIKDVAGTGVIQTAFNGATATNYTTTDVAEPHGGANILWGTTWTDTDVKAANFGVAFAATVTLGGAVNVDHLQVRVHYTTNPIDHVAINAPANAMALTEVPVVIAPHTSVHGAVTAASTINLSTSTGTGDWTIGSGTGVLTPGVADSGLASYTFGAGESGVALGFMSSAAGTVTLNVSDIWGRDLLLSTPVAEKANTITFTTPSFVFTDSACVHNVAFGAPGQTCALFNWSPQVAGQDAPNVYITSVDTAGVPTRLSRTRTRTRNMQFGLSCHDPLANAGKMATFASATSVTLPLCQANGALPVAWSAILTATFPAGIPSAGPFTFNYPDVGMVELWMRNSATTTQRGASGAFVVKPGGFVVSNIVRSSDGFANPAAANAAGVAFVKAGEAFSATVTATTCTPASATCTVAGAATPNFGKEISPESVRLVPALKAGLGLTHNPAITCGDASNAATCDTTTTPGTNIPKFGAFIGGTATGVNFAWDEVGIITLTPHVGDASYLEAGDVTGTTSGDAGRFVLAKFALQNVAFDERADLCQGGLLVADGVTPCAPSFTYMGEQIDANFTLVPKSLSGVTVQNYVDSVIAANDFAKLDPTVFADLNLAAIDSTTAGGPHYLTGRISNAALPVASCATVPCFQSGSADVMVPFLLTRNATPDGAYTDVNIGIAPVDADGARVEGAGAVPGLCNKPNAADCYDLDSDATAGNDHALLAATEFRHGRTLISNAYGSELLGLVLPLATEYWNGSAYVKNANDSETVIAIALGNYQRNLNAGETAATVSAIVNGVGRVTLTPPGANNNGSVDVSATAPDYLPGTSGRATFGVYKGPFIYMREQY